MTLAGAHNRDTVPLNKALDAVDHEILLTKMNRCGIQGKTLDWFKSYLTNRTQRCLVVSLTSPFLNVVCHRERSLALLYFKFIFTICLTVYRSG